MAVILTVSKLTDTTVHEDTVSVRAQVRSKGVYGTFRCFFTGTQV